MINTYKVLVHLENELERQCDHEATYIADSLRSVDEMVRADFSQSLLYWELVCDECNSAEPVDEIDLALAFLCAHHDKEDI